VEIATETTATRDELEAFVAPRRNIVLLTTRRDGSPQASPVTGALGPDGRLLVSSYPTRAKTRNIRRDPRCSAVVLSDDFGGAWVQVYGTGEVLDGEDGVEALVEYYRAAAGEHPDWDEYRQAMRDRSKVCLAVTIERWGPIATGGIPPEFA
jgi:PPOX class probable F420-dependent enzyme